MFYVIGLAWIAVMVAIIATYSRKQRQRGAERAQQMAALLVDLKANPRSAVTAAGGAVAPVVTDPEFVKRRRLLPPTTTLLYYVFRTGLPDHEIFAGLALNDVVDVATGPGGAQRAPLVRKLALQRLDLVVCNKQLEVVAVVVANPAPGSRTDDVQFASQCLSAAGVRVVSVNPSTPPRHTEVHGLIYG
jgi:hypothetical protein